LTDNQRRETWAKLVNRRKRYTKPNETLKIKGTEPSEDTQLGARYCLALLNTGKLDDSTEYFTDYLMKNIAGENEFE
jgi:hypothetical protein